MTKPFDKDKDRKQDSQNRDVWEEQVGARIDEAMKRAGLSQLELAAAAGLAGPSVVGWGKSVREVATSVKRSLVSWWLLKRVADALHVSTDWLLGREGAEAPPPGIDLRAVRRAVESLREVEGVRAGLEAALRDAALPHEER